MGVILKRKKDESIILKTKEGDIEIFVMHGTNTKLNITAPQSVKIWRKELLDENNQLLSRDRTVASTIEDKCGI